MIVIIIICAIAVSLFVQLLFGSICETLNAPYILTPKIIYNGVKVNWFGAIGLYLIYIICCPIFFICSLGVIGRK